MLNDCSASIFLLYFGIFPFVYSICYCPYLFDIQYCSLFDPTGHCMANEQYIAQLKETFATSVPNQIAAFFGEPIQVQYSVVRY